MPSRFRVVVIAILCIWGGVARAQSQPLPTTADLQEMMDAKAYRVCLQNIARVMTITGDAAMQYDRVALYLMRGECLVQLDDSATAIYAYQAALKDANNIGQSDQARAMMFLLRRSPRLTFTPPSGENIAPLNVKDPAQRKQAMLYLFQEQLRLQAQAIKDADGAKSLPPIIKALPDLRTLHALEVGGTGTDAQTRPLLMGIGEQARGLITAELDRMHNNIDRINASSSQVVITGNGATGANGRWWANNTGSIGLTFDDRNNLRDIINYTQNILDVSQQGRQVALSFGADGKVWEPIINQAANTIREAQSVLDRE